MRFDVNGAIDMFVNNPVDAVIISIIGVLAIRGFVAILNDIGHFRARRS